MYGAAVFSGPDQRYRYLLWRCWDIDAHQLSFVLCNPSTAGGLVGGRLENDRTVYRLIDISVEDGAGGFVLVNLVGHVEPKSGRLRHEGIEGQDNADHLRDVLALPNKVVIGWGAQPLLRGLSRSLLSVLADRQLWCVGTNKVSGTPMHPLQRGPRPTRLVSFTTAIQ